MTDQVEHKVRRPWLLAAAGAAVVLVGVAVVVAMSRGGEPKPAPFTLSGKLELSADGAFSANPRCGGKGGYDDINRGASVTVYDAGGTVVATGELGEGRFVGQKLDDPCAFPFTVANVPGGGQFYQVEVSHRGKVTVTADAAKAGAVKLTLG